MVKLNSLQKNLLVVVALVLITSVIWMMLCKRMIVERPVEVIQKEVVQNDSMIDVLTGQNIALNNHIHNLNLEIQMYRKLLDKNKKQYDKEIDFIDGLDADEQLLLLAKNIDSIRYKYMSFGE
jgi:hypothetical protein